MKPTGLKITKAESRHVNSLAAHIQPIAKSIEGDIQVCQEANWEGMDRCYIEGKLADLQANMRAMQRVLDDMLPELWEARK